MLDDFKDEQPIIYKILLNSVKKNNISHAYLFELNGYSKGLNIALAFAKFLMCPSNKTNNLKCNECNQCELINNNNFLELKIIDTDSQWIKKEQLEELQKEFMTKSLVSNKKVYIINNAEKLNASSSNSLLKFLEEPPEGIVAILLVNNIYQLLETIISRCQILSFKKNTYIESLNSIDKIARSIFNESKQINEFVNDFGKIYIDVVIEYIRNLETKKEDTIIYYNKPFLQVFNDRKKIILAFDLFILYYKDVLNNILNVDCEYYFDYMESINYISEKNSIDTITKKIKIIVNLQANIKFNLNSNLLLDKLVIKICEV